MTEDEMVGWHHQLDGPEFEQALGKKLANVQCLKLENNLFVHSPFLSIYKYHDLFNMFCTFPDLFHPVCVPWSKWLHKEFFYTIKIFVLFFQLLLKLVRVLLFL